jgi:5-methylcytosine-specific restriction endonuclease McrA
VIHTRAGAYRGRIHTRAATPVARRLARSRREYDARRRRLPLHPQDRDELRAYARLVRADPCSYCMGYCGQMAADHIVPLDAGGENRASNLTAAGRPCNAAKKGKSLLLFLATRSPV